MNENMTHPDILQAEATGNTTMFGGKEPPETAICPGCGEPVRLLRAAHCPVYGDDYHADCMMEVLLDNYPVIQRELDKREVKYRLAVLQGQAKARDAIVELSAVRDAAQRAIERLER